MSRFRIVPGLILLALVADAAACGGAKASKHIPHDHPIVQPGAPGEPSRRVTAADAAAPACVAFTDADVRFMQHMIGHHAQAIEMAQLLRSRTTRDDMKLLGRRIELSQSDEIALMQGWLRARGQEVPSGHVHELMPGMLTPEEMDRLAHAQGAQFDRLFLEGMIKHHDGALVMVKQLLDDPGAGEDAELFAFASDVDIDQRIEIARMGAVLAELPK
jgi:uncharacterized protein (DUF305 family)